MGVWKLKRLFLLVMLLYAFFLCACEESSADENEVSDTITENIFSSETAADTDEDARANSELGNLTLDEILSM